MVSAAFTATAAGAGTCGAIGCVMLLAAMVATNMVALYSLSIARDVQKSLLTESFSDPVLRELASIREELKKAKLREPEQEQSLQGPLQSAELTEFTAERALPLGRNPNYGLETMVSPVGHQCYLHRELLDRYMDYRPGEVCPDDWNVGQALMLRGCEPLPRRRCFARTPPSVTEPHRLPGSLWRLPRDSSVLWTHYACKSYGCLKNRSRNSTVFYDCADCFDLTGPESYRWVSSRDRRDFLSLEDIVRLKKGSIRIGLDIGGGTGSFAARMLEQNVTIVTTTLNLNGPFNEFIASRGLVPVYMTISTRLPFFDNTMDIVHTMHVLSNWLPIESLEFVLYDIDRVLRPGGLFWLDHFFCTEGQLESLYVPLIEMLKFKKIKWVVGKKLDRNGIMNKEVYLSALLEKPVRG